LNQFAPIALAAIVLPFWLLLFLQGRRLYRTFLRKYPQEARASIPMAFTNCRHPEQLFFFLRKKSRPILQRDPDLWRMRQRFVALMALFLAIPTLFIILCLVIASRG